MPNRELMGYAQTCCCNCRNNIPENTSNEPASGSNECIKEACPAWEAMLSDSDVIITRKSDWDAITGPITFPGQVKKRGWK